MVVNKSKLIGKTTPGGWTLISTREPGGCHSGSRHSLGYIAENSSGEHAYVKVLDIRLGLEKGDDIQKALQILTVRIDRFRYEWGLAKLCNAAGLSGVVRGLEQGAFTVEGEDNPVPYIVFELADRDLREQSELSRRFDLAFRMRVLHKTAVGLSQLHGVRIAL